MPFVSKKKNFSLANAESSSKQPKYIKEFFSHCRTTNHALDKLSSRAAGMFDDMWEAFAEQQNEAAALKRDANASGEKKKRTVSAKQISKQMDAAASKLQNAWDASEEDPKARERCKHR